MGHGVPEGWWRNGECSVPSGELGFGDGGEKISICRAEAASVGVAMEEVIQVWGGKDVQGFEGDEEALEINALLYSEVDGEWEWFL